MSYDFYIIYIKHIMCALEWKLNAMINKDKSSINKVPVNWTHPVNGKFEKYRI